MCYIVRGNFIERLILKNNETKEVTGGKGMFTADIKYVKPLGRTYYTDKVRWLAFSGTGVEFECTGKKVNITLLGDNSVLVEDNYSNQARIGIFVNGERVLDTQMDQLEKTVTILLSKQSKSAIVAIIKLSECAMSTVGIKQIEVEKDGIIIPTKEKQHKIEVIGDSITCGYGIDDENEQHHFTTMTEDVTKAYAYQTIQALDADYSIVSISGYGIISGYTDTGVKNEVGILPRYYDKMGFSYGKFALQYEPQNIEWDFCQFCPDVIVINLGTNDDSYCQGDPSREEEYRLKYTEFLHVVRKKNPDAMILCTLGMMGDRLYQSLEQAVRDFIEQTQDTKIYCMPFEPQKEEDGYVADWHPTVKTNTKAAQRLTNQIKKIMHW